MTRLLIVLTVLLALPAASHAEVISEESFAYHADTPLKGLNGGKGWDGAWFASPLNRNDNLVVSPGLSSGDLVRVGNRMKQIGNDVRSFRKIDASRPEVAALVEDGKYGKTFGKQGTTIWVGFLISCTSYPRAAYGGIHLCDGLGDLTKDAFGDKKAHQRISMGRSNMSKNWYLGRVTNGEAGSGKWESEIRADDKVRFLVYRFDFNKGSVTARLFIDPPTGKAPDAKTAAITALDVTDFRFNTLSVGAGSGTEFALDEIRIGTEFKDVAPAVKK